MLSYCLAGRSWSWKRSWRLWATIWNLWKSVSKRYLVWPRTKHLSSHAAMIKEAWPACLDWRQKCFLPSSIQFQTHYDLFSRASFNVGACLAQLDNVTVLTLTIQQWCLFQVEASAGLGRCVSHVSPLPNPQAKYRFHASSSHCV